MGNSNFNGAPYTCILIDLNGYLGALKRQQINMISYTILISFRVKVQ